MADRVEIAAIRPTATAEEVAAIVSAIELSWPEAVVVDEPDEPTRWRFSGRWWTKPIALRRDRPWQ
jgi:hypothetical protein